jgi:hypothetical protein
MSTRQELGRIGYTTVYSLSNGVESFFFEAGMMIDADGAYRAYHRDNKSGLDYLGNAGTSGNWWALVTDNGLKTGKPIIQKATDPAPGFYVSTTSLEDSKKVRTDPRRYVDSETIPYFVLPLNKKFGAKLGDFGVVYNPTKELLCGGVFADTGPAGKIGEASIAMAKAVGVPESPKHGGQAHGLLYVVFPKSGNGWPLTTEVIQQKALALFNAWGGIPKLKELLP